MARQDDVKEGAAGWWAFSAVPTCYLVARLASRDWHLATTGNLPSGNSQLS